MASHSVDPYGAAHGLDLLCMWPGTATFTLHEWFFAHLGRVLMGSIVSGWFGFFVF